MHIVRQFVFKAQILETISMDLIDTHCHLHDLEFFKEDEAQAALEASSRAGVKQVIGIATSLEDSKRAIKFAHKHPKHYWASVGIHPHEAAKLSEEQIKENLRELDKLASDKMVIAIGECGFDFYYHKADELLERQTQLLIGQLEIAQKHKLPISFHVREAFDHFWPIFDRYSDIKGVLHSFTDTEQHLNKALKQGLYIGVNGIATFTKSSEQIEMFKQIPLKNIVVETDSPFLTPNPKRGKINEPKNVTYITTFMAELRGEDVKRVASSTTANARKLFGL